MTTPEPQYEEAARKIADQRDQKIGLAVYRSLIVIGCILVVGALLFAAILAFVIFKTPYLISGYH